MKNLDLLQKQKTEIMVKMNQAMKDGNEEAFAQAFTEFTDLLQEAVMSEAKGLVQAADNHVLAGRGARALTSQEREYYEGLAQAMRASNPKQELADFNVVLPETVVDAIFEDITESHPLLEAINFEATGALVEILVSTMDGRQLATWGKLSDTIIKELSAGFTNINLAQKKLSAFLPVCKAMLDLGPVWLDRYVRAHLSEAIFNGLEAGIINGSGLDQPVGMRRDPNSALDPATGYGLQQLIPLNELSPEEYGAILSRLSVAPTGLQRTIKEVLLIVSPVDYFTKIFPASTLLNESSMVWVGNVFPFPTRVVQSVYVPQGEAIIGLGKRYFMGIGTGKGGKIEYSDEYHFLEDERMYLTKLYGDGKPLDSTSFMRLDITKLKPVQRVIRVTPYVDATLESLTIASGTVVMTPGFDSSIHYYTAETENATDLVTAVATDATEAVITATLNGEETDLGSNQAWVEGQNVVVITVTNGSAVEVYVLVVTYTTGT
jgi:hypothetical protein